MEKWIVFLHSTLALQGAGNQMRPGCYCGLFAALNSANASECWRCLVLLFFFFPVPKRVGRVRARGEQRLLLTISHVRDSNSLI